MRDTHIKGITQSDVEQMKALKKEGLTLKKIGEKFNIGSSTVDYHLKGKSFKKNKKPKLKSFIEVPLVAAPSKQQFEHVAIIFAHLDQVKNILRSL